MLALDESTEAAKHTAQLLFILVQLRDFLKFCQIHFTSGEARWGAESVGHFIGRDFSKLLPIQQDLKLKNSNFSCATKQISLLLIVFIIFYYMVFE